MALALLTLLEFNLQVQAGSWTQLVNPAPDYFNHIMLLSDGTVLAAEYQESLSSNWYRLTPDSNGSYVKGTWTNIAPMHYTRLFFSSTLLRDGRLFVAGGEYGTGGATAEIYDPTSDIWTVVSPPTNLLDATQVSPSTGQFQSIADAECKLLPDGRVLICPPHPKVANGTLIYDPVANSWSAGAPTLQFIGESTAVKLADGSLLTVDADKSSSERYLPALNIWTNDASTALAYLWATLTPYIGEIGPASLLPDGRAIFFGGTGQTALYTPSGDNGPGTWAPGPNIPANLVAADTSGAMMANGNILLAVAPAAYVTNGNNVVFPTPTTFYEYNYSAGSTGSFTQVTGLNATVGSYVTMMLDLPDGSVLFGLIGNKNLFDYQPSGVPLAAGKPAIATITLNGDGSYHLTGTLFNGISEGASYGDDHQMASNFPLVRFIDKAGHVRYGRTYNWSSTGVMTGSAVVSTDCMPPPGTSISDTIQVVANGIASDGVSLLVTTTADSGLGSLRQVAGLLPGGGPINLADNLSGQTIILTSGEITLNQNCIIDGSGLSSPLIVSGNRNSRILHIGANATVVVNNLVFTNGYAADANSGGAIANDGFLTLNGCTLAGNSTTAGGVGGAIYNGGMLRLSACTLSENSAGFAGAIANYGNANLVNCTLAGNSTPNNGGAVDNVQATLSLLQCTISGNSAGGAGGGVDNYLGQVDITNSIVADNGMDIYNWNGPSTITLSGANIIPQLVNDSILIPLGARIVAEPLLGPLTNNGGATLTMLPQPGSPAIDAGQSGALTGLSYDQCGPGFPRVVGAEVDIGAIEAPVIPFVFNPADSGYGSLRYVAGYAPNNSTITFAPTLAGQTISLTDGEIPINQNCIIDGSGLSGPVIVNGNNSSRIFNIGANATVVVNNLVFTNGHATNDTSGGAIVNDGSLTLNACTLAGNSTTASGAGGAIYNRGLLKLSACTLSGNSAAFAGAINNYGTASLVSCTLAGNSTPNNGGAIDNVQATLSLLQCTISGNSAGGAGGGLDNYLGQVDIANSIVADNGVDIFNWPGAGTITLNGVDIILQLVNGGILIPLGTRITAEPLLGPLTNNGGPTLTMLPQPGSPAIDAGLSSAVAGLSYDQRGSGFPRIFGAEVDIGAVEVQIIIADLPALLTGESRLTNGAFALSFTNRPGASFTVLVTTNLALRTTVWSKLGPALESPLGSGKFQFLDLSASHSLSRFYRVSSP